LYLAAGTGALNAAENAILASLNPSLRAKAIAHRAAVLRAGIPFTFTSGKRSTAQQAALYAKLSKVGKPVARPGTSQHEKAEAYDAVGPRNAGEWRRFGELGEAQGLRWGGRFSNYDPVHFEQKAAPALHYAAVGPLLALALLGALFRKGLTRR
jgi:hypothetical protein